MKESGGRLIGGTSRGFLLNQRVACLSPATGAAAVYVAECHAGDDELEATELIRRPAGARILSRHRRRLAETARRRLFLFLFLSFPLRPSHDIILPPPVEEIPSKSAPFVRRRSVSLLRVPRRAEACTSDNCFVDDYSAVLSPVRFSLDAKLVARNNRRIVFFLDEKIVVYLDEKKTNCRGFIKGDALQVQKNDT